jgi:hypothetical protein
MKKSVVKLLAEAFLIVFSVLLAFWIERKSQQSRDEDLKALLLEQVFVDLRNDSIHFAAFLEKHDFVEEKLETLIVYTNAGKLEQDSLVSLLRAVEWVFSFSPNNTTYQSIVSAGQLSLFEQDTLFQKINRYYSVHEKKMVMWSEMYGTGITRFLDDYLNRYFDRRLFHEQYKDQAHPIDLKQFSSREFSNVLLSLQDFLIKKGELVYQYDRLNELLRQMRTSSVIIGEN